MTVKPTVVVTVITFILAAAAGVAIAGLPSEAPGADIRVTDIQVVTPTTTPVLAPLEVSPLVDDEEPVTTTEPAPEASTTTSTTTMGPPTTSAFLDQATTTVPDDDEETATGDVLRERAELSVATANATDIGGVAGAHAEELQGYGYVNVTPVDTSPSAESAVFYQPGFDLEATRMAEELGWGLLATAPYAELPVLQTDSTFELVALVGLDQA